MDFESAKTEINETLHELFNSVYDNYDHFRQGVLEMPEEGIYLSYINGGIIDYPELEIRFCLIFQSYCLRLRCYKFLMVSTVPVTYDSDCIIFSEDFKFNAETNQWISDLTEIEYTNSEISNYIMDRFDAIVTYNI